MLDRKVAFISIGILAVFILLALVFRDAVTHSIDTAFAASSQWFGGYWQYLLLVTFLVAIVLAFTPYARARMGGTATVEYSRFKWLAMIMSTLLAGGGVFWAAAEPVAHYLDEPPHFGTAATAQERVTNALAQSFVDWGFLAWAILGTLGAVVMSYAQLPLSLPVAVFFLILTTMFVTTTTDSMSFAIAQSCTASGEPSTRMRATWAVIMGVAAAVLISIGDGGIGALQSFIVITAVPVGFLMLPSVFAAPVFARRMAIEQGVVTPRGETARAAGEGSAEPAPEAGSGVEARSGSAPEADTHAADAHEAEPAVTSAGRSAERG